MAGNTLIVPIMMVVNLMYGCLGQVPSIHFFVPNCRVRKDISFFITPMTQRIPQIVHL